MQITGNTVTINPNLDLAPGTGYYVEVQDDAVEDLAGDPFEGFGGPGFDFITQRRSGRHTDWKRAGPMRSWAASGDDTIAGLGGKDTLTGRWRVRHLRVRRGDALHRQWLRHNH